ncbi:TPA: ParA family protein [Staphylococcus aureus]|nr:ParA family protein [Staphylococcus aureus]
MVKEDKFPTIVTISQQKGGTGKSTITKNLTNYLALDKNKKVLNIDGDYSVYLTTNLYNVYETQGNIGEIFTKDNKDGSKNVCYYNVHPNIDLVVGDPYLHEKLNSLEMEEGKSFYLLRWVSKHQKELSEYDFIIIDTHNDFSLFTKNAIVISDVVLAPLDPSDPKGTSATRMEFEFKKLERDLLDPISNKPYVNANFYIIGNRIAKNTASHKEFLKLIQERKDYLTWIPRKELFVKASKEIKTMDQMNKEESNRHNTFYSEYSEAMERIYSVIKIQ